MDNKQDEFRTFKLCPCCGEYTLRTQLELNSLSRYRDMHICNRCGNIEALRGEIKDWYYDVTFERDCMNCEKTFKTTCHANEDFCEDCR